MPYAELRQQSHELPSLGIRRLVRAAERVQLRLVLPRIYDGAFPFEKGRAVVCFGCTKRIDGEHSFYAGGSWACIDPRGREIRPRREAEGYKACD